MIVHIQLDRTSQPIIYSDANNVYQKGDMICVEYETHRPSEAGEPTRWTDKYPLQNVWRIRSSYGYSGKYDR